MFFLTAGETRINGLPYAGEDGGVNWAPTLFVMSYVLVVNWVLLQVGAVNFSNFRENEEYKEGV